MKKIQKKVAAKDKKDVSDVFEEFIEALEVAGNDLWSKTVFADKEVNKELEDLLREHEEDIISDVRTFYKKNGYKVE